jgi:hypothetical protein
MTRINFWRTLKNLVEGAVVDFLFFIQVGFADSRDIVEHLLVEEILFFSKRAILVLNPYISFRRLLFVVGVEAPGLKNDRWYIICSHRGDNGSPTFDYYVVRVLKLLR